MLFIHLISVVIRNQTSEILLSTSILVYTMISTNFTEFTNFFHFQLKFTYYYYYIYNISTNLSRECFNSPGHYHGVRFRLPLVYAVNALLL